MTLDIVVATCNRALLLRKALESIAAAPQVPDLTTNVVVVDNNSTDGTEEVVRQAAKEFGGRLQYLREARQGKPYALNTGIAASDGDLVGMIDDDEEIHPGWLAEVQRAFRDPDVDFVGGPYIPKWPCPRPEWLPLSYRGAIGWAEPGDTVRRYGPDEPDLFLQGGNAVIRRSVLQRCGPYATDVSRTHSRLLSGEDADMFERLVAAGARGVYLPQLIIFHHIPLERLTKRYFRRWACWCGVSTGMIRARRRDPAPHLLGIPRWQFRVTAAGVWGSIRACFNHSHSARFKGELDVLYLLGMLYGRHIFRHLRKFERV